MRAGQLGCVLMQHLEALLMVKPSTTMHLLMCGE